MKTRKIHRATHTNTHKRQRADTITANSQLISLKRVVYVRQNEI